MNGTRVLYQQQEYIVIHKYETGYCELKTFRFLSVYTST